MRPEAPYVRDLLIVGGGHSNVEVLRRYGMKPEPGVRVTVVAREPHTPYSGMLPGYLAGKYTWDEIHIDLLKLSTFAKARFVPDEVTRVNLDEQTVSFASRPDIRYDVIVINTGGAPGKQFQGNDLVIPVKPIGRFIPEWNQVVSRHAKGKGFRLTVVGGGPGSVEVSLAIKERYGEAFKVNLVTANDALLKEHPKLLERTIVRHLQKNNITVSYDFNVVDVTDRAVLAADHRKLESDCVLWVAGVEAPNWVRESGFAVDSGGFLRVDKRLQSISNPRVFAAGDIVCLDGQERPKSGVYAVRAGPYLAQNTRRALKSRPLRKYRAQRKALAILRISHSRAVATKGPLSMSSRPVEVWKDWLDRTFMRRYSALPSMDNSGVTLKPKELRKDQPDPLRCGGCGSKLGADLLEKVLRRLGVDGQQVHEIGDDAAIVDWNSPRFATSCDGFRAMVTDPFQFGRLSANHALNDLYAMGSEPKVALALVTVPLMSQSLMEDELYQAMSGALSVFRESNTQLVGGHSAEGSELSLGFAVTGTVPDQPILNSSMVSGHALILTKPVGTGLLLAGIMRRTTTARDLMSAVSVMDQSNAAAARIFLEFSPSAMTDVTGFGLLGHISEISRRSNVHVELVVDQIPILDGVKEALMQEVRSSLHDNNMQSVADYDNSQDFDDSLITPLVDPQTCGGLVAAIPSDFAAECVDRLRAAGYHHAVQIGESMDAIRSRLV
ncbi:MAG: selenide, water dikinase SelD [Gammaproteobacteria bacterium]|nr:selenide, water dikinase SelD [Gammaproteobacteria bacterium]